MKKSMDADIESLARMMRNALHFVDNPSVKSILTRSEDAIEDILKIIHQLSQHICKDLDTPEIGKAYSLI